MYKLLCGGKLWCWENMANLANGYRFTKLLFAKFFLLLKCHVPVECAFIRQLLLGMSILQYFNCASAKSNATNLDQLPDPNGLLSSSVPPKAIDVKVTKVKDETLGGARSVYLILSPAQRYEISKRAAEHGVTAFLHYYAKKYPELPLKETSVRRFKKFVSS